MPICSRRDFGRYLGWAALAGMLKACAKKPVPVPAVFRVKFSTTAGDFIVEAHHDWAPHGVDRFMELLQMRYFDQGRFFRVVPGFIAQFGVHKDYETHRVWRALYFIDDPVKEKNTRGMLSFAQSGPNTRATEIFINLADNHMLDEQKFVPFARIVEGIEVVDRLYSGYGELRPQGKLLDPGAVEEQANAYLEPRFPKLDYIKRAEILG
ncbi:MAG: peptidylprolyl isomerase [Acidobacteriota bacterium]